MNIVIPYRDEIHKGLELKFALRSIEKNLTGWDEIILIGDHPHWFIGNSIQTDDRPASKNFNIYNKILTAIKFNVASDNFVMYHDDHFALKTLHISQIKYWHNGLLKNELLQIVDGNIIKTAGGRYRKAIENTLEVAPETFNWDIHVPIVFNKDNFRRVFEGRQDEVCVKSLYCHENSFHDPGIIANSEFMEDLKIPFQMPYERLKEKIKDRTFFSIDSAAIGDDLKRLWEELYPEPSKFEL